MHFASILSPPNLKQTVRLWMKEDVSSFDYASLLFKDEGCTASIILKDKGVLAGVPLVNTLLKEMNCEVEWNIKEGTAIVDVPVEVGCIKGSTRNIIRVERLMLNILARASGIATASKRMKDILVAEGWKGHMAGTRKTTPGFRLVEKYAMLIGGADTHRYDLSSMIMLKDNHIVASGSITGAVKESRRVGGFSVKIEVECQNLAEAEEAGLAGADIVMLDNMKPEKLGPASAAMKAKFPHVMIEASGGITENTVASYALPCVDIISCSRLSQGYSTLNFSLSISPCE